MSAAAPLWLCFVAQVINVIGDSFGQRAARVSYKISRRHFIMALSCIYGFQMFVWPWRHPAIPTWLHKTNLDEKHHGLLRAAQVLPSLWWLTNPNPSFHATPKHFTSYPFSSLSPSSRLCTHYSSFYQSFSTTNAITHGGWTHSIIPTVRVVLTLKVERNWPLLRPPSQGGHGEVLSPE